MNQIEYTGRDNLEVMREAKNYNRFLLELILSQANIHERIVDFGAGSGTLSLPVVASGYRLICVETDPVLSSYLASCGMNVVGDLEMLEDNSIDYLYTLNVLEHIDDDESIARLWLQKLRPGGKLLVYVPAFELLFSSMDHKVGHFRRYTKKTLNATLKRAGFHVDKVKYADSIGYLATLIYKAFDNGQGSVNLSMLKVYDRWVFPLSRLLDFVASPFVGKNVYACAVKLS